jgi:signal transduction histidine kinase
VRHGAPPIVVSAARTERDLRVVIEDNGPGVAPEFVGSLFERFTRGSTDSSVGAGLGLSIALSFTRAHGGTLTYEPGRPTGSVFTLSLPLGGAGLSEE